jgi:hypothetical protein
MTRDELRAAADFAVSAASASAQQPTAPPPGTPMPEREAASTPSFALPPDSGLVMVETRFAPPIESDEPVAPRPRRVRPAPVAIPEEPLQLVETRKDQPSP